MPWKLKFIILLENHLAPNVETLQVQKVQKSFSAVQSAVNTTITLMVKVNFTQFHHVVLGFISL